MITQEKLNSIHKLPLSDIRLVLDECLEALGVADIQMAKDRLGIGRARVYQVMKPENTLQIHSHKYLCINLINQEA